ncbi:hypothetical protein BD414DRAFT_457550 [Trametes punicea]|nr:hypothetical protein BD414DRAFT_457550 [Trametes punicea]
MRKFSAPHTAIDRGASAHVRRCECISRAPPGLQQLLATSFNSYFRCILCTSRVYRPFTGLMERLPYDVLHIIFQIVCTDGGSTGCALALTSKSVRAASALTRLYSVSLGSLYDIQRFLVCFERIRRFDGVVPPIQHLFLSFLPGHSCDAPLRNWRKWTDYARTESGRLRQLMEDQRAWLTAKTEWNLLLVLHLSRLFEVAGPSLQTLTVLQAREVRLPLVRYHFPVLRELTLFGDDRLLMRVPLPVVRLLNESDPSDLNFYGVSLPSGDGPAGVPFPSLERVHVVFAYPKLHRWEQTLRQWAVLAPAVRYLRISQGDAQVIRILRDAFGLPAAARSPADDQSGGGEASAEPILAPAPTYPNLRRFVVVVEGDSSDLKRAAERVSAKRELNEDEEAEIRILNGRTVHARHWLLRLERDWEDRMRGGDGCWAEDEIDEETRGEVVVPPSIQSEGTNADVPKRRWRAVFWKKAHTS